MNDIEQDKPVVKPKRKGARRARPSAKGAHPTRRGKRKSLVKSSAAEVEQVEGSSTPSPFFERWKDVDGDEDKLKLIIPRWADRIGSDEKADDDRSHDAAFVETFKAIKTFRKVDDPSTRTIPGHGKSLPFAALRWDLDESLSFADRADLGLVVVGSTGGGGKTTLMRGLFKRERGLRLWAHADEALSVDDLLKSREKISEAGAIHAVYPSFFEAFSDALRMPPGSRVFIDGGRYLMWNTSGPLGQYGVPANLGLALTAMHNIALDCGVSVVISLNPAWESEAHLDNFRGILRDSVFTWLMISERADRREVELVSRIDRKTRLFDASSISDIDEAMRDPREFTTVGDEDSDQSFEQEMMFSISDRDSEELSVSIDPTLNFKLSDKE